MADLINERNWPAVLTGLVDKWQCRYWTPTQLANVLGSKKYSCKIAPRNSQDIVWETDCVHIEASLSDFCDWTAGETGGDNPLSDISPLHFSCYVDYKYMHQMFENNQEILESVDWSVCGLEGRDGHDSTIWIGSTGASTPCHYDTYGFNLVAQIYGRKRWHLFPPSASKYLYPTRLPYEESSVFSEVNVSKPDFDKTPKFKESEGLVVTLEPGQVLYVPRHWWHYVECLDTAISINTWVDMPDDNESRLHESVTRALVSTLMTSEMADTVHNWLNPNEEIMSMDVNWAYLATSLQAVIDRTPQNAPTQEDNLKKVFTHLHGKNFQMLHAPWQINRPRNERCHGSACDEYDNNTDDSDSMRKCETVFGRKRKHDSTESQKCKRIKHDSKRVHLESNDKDIDCHIFVLNPSTFKIYYETVHEKNQFRRLMPIDETKCNTPFFDTNLHPISKPAQCDNEKMTSDSGFDVCASNDVVNMKTSNDSESNDMQKIRDIDAINPEKKAKELKNEQLSKSIPNNDFELSSVKGQETYKCRKDSSPNDCNEDNRLPRVDKVRDVFLKTLLHPRVVHVLAEQLIDGFAERKKLR